MAKHDLHFSRKRRQKLTEQQLLIAYGINPKDKKRFEGLKQYTDEEVEAIKKSYEEAKNGNKSS